MSKDLNKAMCTGRLGADPELRYTEDGAPVATFRVASHRSYRNQQSGQETEETEWFYILVWNQLAELCNAQLRKGNRVYVEGRIHTSKLPQGDGSTRYMVELVAFEVIFLDRAQGEAEAEAEPATAAAPAPSAIPATPSEAEQRFYARYGEQIGGQSWSVVQHYLGISTPRPHTVQGWMDAALAVRNMHPQPHLAPRENFSPGARAARGRH